MPSLLRGYSAPVKMAVEGQTDEDLVFLLAHDTGEGCKGAVCGKGRQVLTKGWGGVECWRTIGEMDAWAVGTAEGRGAEGCSPWAQILCVGLLWALCIMHSRPRPWPPMPTDPFNRWEAGQVLAKKLMVHLYQAARDESKVGVWGGGKHAVSACIGGWELGFLLTSRVCGIPVMLAGFELRP